MKKNKRSVTDTINRNIVAAVFGKDAAIIYDAIFIAKPAQPDLHQETIDIPYEDVTEQKRIDK